MTLDPAGPEVRALFITRRWILTMLSCLLVLVATRGAVNHWPQLSAQEHVALVVSIGLAVAGAVFGGRPALLWLSDAAVLVLALTALLAPVGSPPWLPMPNVASYVAFIAITLTSRRVGLVLACAGAAFVALIWAHRPTNIVVSALELWGGWIVVAQILATALATWWAWNAVAREAAMADRDFRRQARAAEVSIAQQERARLWRAEAARLHESVLNSIRYVLATPHPDRDRLAEQLALAAASPQLPEQPDACTVEQLIAAVMADPVAGQVVRPPAAQRAARLQPDTFEVARAALVEIARNAVRHGSATQVDLSYEVDRASGLTIRSRDNGTGLSAQARPGIGMGTVLADSLESVGGSVVVAAVPDGGTHVTLTVPLAESSDRFAGLRRVYSPFDKGRLLITAPLAGSFCVGIIYFLLLTPFATKSGERGIEYLVAAVAGIVGAALAASLVVRRQHVSALTGLGLIMLPAIVPWALSTTGHGCGEAAILAAVVNVAGFAVVTIAAWSGVLPGVAGVLTWATGTVMMASHLPSACRDGINLALANSLLVIPVALVGTYVGVRTHQRAADRLNQARRRELREQSRAETAIDLNESLFGAAEEAVLLLSSVSRGAPVDDSLRGELEAVDARIRAAIQVDSTLAGGFAVLAKGLVDAATIAGVAVEVRAIGASADPRPLPQSVKDLLAAVVAGTREIAVILQVFTDGQHDYLSVVVDGHGVADGALRCGEIERIEEVEMQVIEEEPDDGSSTARFTVLVSRPVNVPVMSDSA